MNSGSCSKMSSSWKWPILLFSYSPTVKITIQIHPFAETYGKQTLNGILLSNEKMSCRHTKYFTKAKRRFAERVSQACDLFYRMLLHNQ